MKKLALALMSASVAVFGFGMVVSAAGYDPAISVDPASPAPGGAYTVTYENCFVGDTITFTQDDSTPTSVTGECEPVNGVVLGSVIALLAQQGPELGVAVGEFDAAPTEAGVYDGTGVGERSPSLPFQFEIKVATEPTDPPTEPTTPTTEAPGGTLPQTGSNGIGTTTGIALGLFAAGLGMFVVAQVRRRQAPKNI
jgi:LPXTG-motif cell wall-anchored protein